MNLLSKKFLFVILMMASALSMSAVTSSDVKAIKAGNILHCFDWTYNQILSELDNIKAAGFTSIQTSPAQTNYTGSTVWNTLYRPRDTEVGPNTLGTKDDLTALCTAAHQKGLYIIVDVVANHTDGVLTYVADYWKNTDLYHDTDCNYSANDGSRYAVTHGDIGMCDLKTYDERVYSKFKTYIQALKACGVDGIRWDAAKHIGLPSEGDNFWSNALDKEMYNYGEVLNTMGGNSDATTIPELQGFMSVTDANYSTNNLLSAFKGGGVPTVAGCWSFQFNNDKWVYWGESHDTFCNNDGASKGINQNVVDRAYAIAASQNNIPALYFSRPTGGDSNGPSCKAGEKGSTHFTSKEVAEINKLKLACAGEPGYYSNGNGVCSVTRKSGAVIVKGSGSGNVSVANGGGYLAAGTYTDHVSGGTFTVTSTTISGNVGSSGIAVLYNEGVSGGSVSFSQDGGAFTTETLTVTAYLNNCTSGTFSINGGTAQSISSTGTSFTLGQGDEAGTEYTVTWTAKADDGSENSGSVTFKKVGTYTPSCTAGEVCVFYETAEEEVGIWVWNDKVNFTGGVWASKPNMEYMGISASGKNIFKWTYTGSEASAPTGVIFLPGGTQSDDLTYTNHGYYIDNVYDHTVESGAAAPSFSVDKESQAFNNSISVTITPTNGATVVYTTDGTTPTASSTSLSTSSTLKFTATTTLKVALLIDGNVTDVKTYTYTLQEAPAGITIYVKASSAPYLYVWDSNQKALNGTWPGTKMSQTTTVSGETYFYQTFSAESVNIIFNNGSGSQTDDIKNITADTYFTYNGTSGYEKVTPDTPEPPSSDTYTYTITYTNPSNWSSVDCYVWDEGDNNKKYLGTWPGKAMTKSGNNWTITFTTDKKLVKGMVIFNNGSGGTGNQTDDLSLSEYSKISVPTGISAASVNRPSQTIVVYTINGERAATVADLKEAEHILRPGFYVVNGRKFIVK